MEEKFDVNINILPDGLSDPVFEQRETGRTHSPYEREVRLYSLVKNGDVEGVRSAAKALLSSGVVVGRLSDDPVTQMKYLAVSSITLATRYAVEGGLDEMDAYNFSDAWIIQIDKLDRTDEILSLLFQKAEELTKMVAETKNRNAYPPAVRKCMRYINKHLHSTLTLSELSRECGLSYDYLSRLFKKSTGENLSRYILRQKLEASKTLLRGNFDYRDIGYYFSFCSETYYISCFKREFGMTPREYAATINY